MADMSVPRFGGNDRGQLIVTAGVILAILLVALTIVLNGVLFIENYSAQPQPHSIERGHEATHTTYSLLQTTIEKENDALHTTDGLSLRNVSNATETFSDRYRDKIYKLHSVVVGIEQTDSREAWVVTQNESAEYRSSEHVLAPEFTNDWYMGTFTGVRDGEMTVMSASEWQSDADDDLFRIHVSGSDGDWNMWVFNHPSSDRIAIGTEVDPGTGSPTVACSAPADADGANISFSPLAIDGEECDDETFGEGVGDGPYDVYFMNGENATGTYKFVTGQGSGSHLADGSGFDPFVRNTLEGDAPNGTDPTAYDGVYSVTTRVRVTGPKFNMSARKTIAHNQPNTTEPSGMIP